jgi:hypothetical protein
MRLSSAFLAILPLLLASPLEVRADPGSTTASVTAQPPIGFAVLDTHHLLKDHWTLVQAPDGTLSRARERRRPHAAVVGVAATVFLGTYVAGAAYVGAQGDGAIGAMPVIGPMVAAWLFATTPGARAGMVVDGVVQGFALVTTLVGLSAGPKWIERQPLHVVPTLMPGGGGVGVSGRF